MVYINNLIYISQGPVQGTSISGCSQYTPQKNPDIFGGFLGLLIWVLGGARIPKGIFWWIWMFWRKYFSVCLLCQEVENNSICLDIRKMMMDLLKSIGDTSLSCEIFGS